MHINAFLEWEYLGVESSDSEEGLNITHSENSRERSKSNEHIGNLPIQSFRPELSSKEKHEVGKNSLAPSCNTLFSTVATANFSLFNVEHK